MRGGHTTILKLLFVTVLTLNYPGTPPLCAPCFCPYLLGTNITIMRQYFHNNIFTKYLLLYVVQYVSPHPIVENLWAFHLNTAGLPLRHFMILVPTAMYLSHQFSQSNFGV